MSTLTASGLAAPSIVPNPSGFPFVSAIATSLIPSRRLAGRPTRRPTATRPSAAASARPAAAPRHAPGSVRQPGSRPRLFPVARPEPGSPTPSPAPQFVRAARLIPPRPRRAPRAHASQLPLPAAPSARAPETHPHSHRNSYPKYRAVWRLLFHVVLQQLCKMRLSSDKSRKKTARSSSYARITPPSELSAAISLVDHSVNSSSRSVRSCDWKTARRSSEYTPGYFFGSRQTSAGLRLRNSEMPSDSMASAMAPQETASGKTKEKSRSTAWNRDSSRAPPRRSGSLYSPSRSTSARYTGWRSFLASRSAAASSPKHAIGMPSSNAVAPRPGSSQAGTSAENVSRLAALVLSASGDTANSDSNDCMGSWRMRRL